MFCLQQRTVPVPQRHLGSTVEFLVTAGTLEQCVYEQVLLYWLHCICSIVLASLSHPRNEQNSDCCTVRHVGCSPTLNASALPFVVSAAASAEVHSWTVREVLAGYFPLFGVFSMT